MLKSEKYALLSKDLLSIAEYIYNGREKSKPDDYYSVTVDFLGETKEMAERIEAARVHFIIDKGINMCLYKDTRALLVSFIGKRPIDWIALINYELKQWAETFIFEYEEYTLKLKKKAKSEVLQNNEIAQIDAYHGALMIREKQLIFAKLHEFGQEKALLAFKNTGNFDDYIGCYKAIQGCYNAVVMRQKMAVQYEQREALKEAWAGRIMPCVIPPDQVDERLIKNIVTAIGYSGFNHPQNDQALPYFTHNLGVNEAFDAFNPDDAYISLTLNNVEYLCNYYKEYLSLIKDNSNLTATQRALIVDILPRLDLDIQNVRAKFALGSTIEFMRAVSNFFYSAACIRQTIDNLKSTING